MATQRFRVSIESWPNQIAGAISTNQRQEYLSTSGNFSIHYVTEGVDAVPNEDANENGIPDFVEWAAEAADSYQLQVNELGIQTPYPMELATIYRQRLVLLWSLRINKYVTERYFCLRR